MGTQPALGHGGELIRRYALGTLGASGAQGALGEMVIGTSR